MSLKEESFHVVVLEEVVAFEYSVLNHFNKLVKFDTVDSLVLALLKREVVESIGNALWTSCYGGLCIRFT
jgi:hypothetical protein